MLASFNLFAQSRKLKEEFKSKTRIENPFDLRDPFKAPLVKLTKQDKKEESYLKDGIYTNLKTPGEIDLNNLKIIGVLVGKERRALARIGESPEVINLREGMKIGADQAELKAILPGGIILVEKLVNVYGEEEYLETVIPISR